MPSTDGYVILNLRLLSFLRFLFILLPHSNNNTEQQFPFSPVTISKKAAQLMEANAYEEAIAEYLKVLLPIIAILFYKCVDRLLNLTF